MPRRPPISAVHEVEVRCHRAETRNLNLPRFRFGAFLVRQGNSDRFLKQMDGQYGVGEK